MNYCQRGRDLLLDLKRSDWLPPYNDENIKAIHSEIKIHFNELNDQAKAAAQVATDRTTDDSSSSSSSNNNTTKSGAKKSSLSMESRPAIVLHEAAIQRNKRCLLAYHAHRLDKLKSLRWDTSASLPGHIRTLLSEAEVDFYTEYDQLVARYNSSLGAIDLNSYIQPPEEDLIEVRVVQPGLGTIVTTDHCGEVNLELGTTHFLPRMDVEHLIRQGSLQQLDGEETS